MKKLLLTLLASLLLTGTAWAEWVRFGSDNDTNFYIDPATIRKDGDIRRVWELQNHKLRAEDGILSARFRSEYDCKQERYRILSFSTHSGPMASGATLESRIGSGQWRDIPPDSNSKDVLEKVCAK